MGWKCSLLRMEGEAWNRSSTKNAKNGMEQNDRSSTQNGTGRNGMRQNGMGRIETRTERL